MKQNRASGTARLIAAATVMCQCRGEPVAPAGAAQWCRRLLSTGRGDRILLASAQSRPARVAWRLVERLTLPGIVAHWMRRKREIDRLSRQAAAEGFEQLVVVGAGLDTLALRLCDEHVFEAAVALDHPATLAVVRAALNGAQWDGHDLARGARSDFELLPIDLLGDDPATVLAAANRFDPSRSVLVVIEGVLMYLPPDTVASVLTALTTIASGRRRLIASWMDAEPAGEIGFHGQSRLVARWLRNRQETMLWASTAEALPAFLAQAGWPGARIIDLSRPDVPNHTRSAGLPGEKLVVADAVAAHDVSNATK